VPFTIKQAGLEATSFLLYDYGFTIYNDTVVVTEDTLKNKRDMLVKWLRGPRARVWVENFKDPAAIRPNLDSWMKGTGGRSDADVFLTPPKKPLMDTRTASTR